MPPTNKSSLIRSLKRFAYQHAPGAHAVPHLNVASEVRDGKRYWQAVNDDPQFLLRKNKALRGSFSAGWYVFKFRLSFSDILEHRSCVYIDYGAGMLESDAVICTARSGQQVTVILRLSRRATHIRFDPVAMPVEFCMDECRLVRVPATVARNLIVKQLQVSREEFSELSSREVLTVIRNEAKSLNQEFTDHLLNEHHRTLALSGGAIAYYEWINSLEPGLINAYQKAHPLPNNAPLVSVIVPVYNAPVALLKQTIESVITQTYQNWQLCLADDASDDKDTIALIDYYAAQYPEKIKVVHLEKNGHISAASNAALSLATGEYCLLLDHDDLLTPNTIDCLLRQLSVNPAAKIIYADEDKISERNHRHSPHFKPDWNLDLLTSQNYICHPLMIQTTVLEEIGGFRLGVEGSQDHDLILRASLVVNESEIHHVPLVLYHWRETENSTASSSQAKSYTTDAGIASIQRYFSQQDIAVTVTQGKFPNTYHCQWPIPEKAPLVSLIIPTRDGYELLKQCLDSILQKTTYTNFEILVVDNQTTCEKTLTLFEDYQQQYPNIRVLSWDAPFNYSAINNFAVAHSNGEVVGLINNDIEVITPTWLEEMVGHALRSEIGCVGAKLYYPNDTIQHAGVILGIGGVAGHAHKYLTRNEPGYFTRACLTQNLSAVTAAVLLVRKSVFEEVSGLNEVELKIAFNDVDFCLRVQEAGYKNIFTPWAELYHHESVSRGKEDSPEKVARFNSEVSYMKQRWSDKLTRDSAYNPNLSMQREDFSM